MLELEPKPKNRKVRFKFINGLDTVQITNSEGKGFCVDVDESEKALIEFLQRKSGRPKIINKRERAFWQRRT